MEANLKPSREELREFVWPQAQIAPGFQEAEGTVEERFEKFLSS